MSSDIESFTAHLQSSKRILALLGAGLSASSGLPTFRGAGGLWRTHDAISLATPEAFGRDPGLVWQFYSYRRHMALKAQPNRAHLALAELARKHPGFLCLSQNVDGMRPFPIDHSPTDTLHQVSHNVPNTLQRSFNCSTAACSTSSVPPSTVPTMARTSQTPSYPLLEFRSTNQIQPQKMPCTPKMTRKSWI
jgi:NAD-dependent deacetylase sirtuin 5